MNRTHSKPSQKPELRVKTSPVAVSWVLEVQRRLTRTSKAMKQLTCKECWRSSAWKGNYGRGIFYREKRTNKTPTNQPENNKETHRKILGVLEMVSRDWQFSFLYKNPWPPNKASRNLSLFTKDTAGTCTGPGRGKISIWQSTLNAWTMSSSEEDSSVKIFPRHPGVALVEEHILH